MLKRIIDWLLGRPIRWEKPIEIKGMNLKVVEKKLHKSK